MIINYLIVLFFFENINTTTPLNTILNTILLSMTLLKDQLDIIKILNPELDNYIKNYNDGICLKVKKTLINHIIKKHVEILVKDT